MTKTKRISLDESERREWKVGLKLNIQKTKIMTSGPITSWQIDGETVVTVADFIFLGSKITADGDCTHEIKRRLLFERKVMTNLDSIFKSRDITLPTKVHPCMTTGKTIALTRWTFVGKVISLLFNVLSRLVITFLSKSKCLLISWLQSPSAVILEPKKLKSATVSTVSPSICHEVIGPDAMILVFWMLSFKPTLSLSSFTFIKRFFSSSLSAIRVVSSAYLRLLIYYSCIKPLSTQLASGYKFQPDLWVMVPMSISFAEPLQCYWIYPRKVPLAVSLGFGLWLTLFPSQSLW